MKNVIGIDIGGTKITGIVWDGKKIADELTIVTPKSLFEFRRNVLKLVDFLSASRKISGIGVGMAGVIDAKKKVAVYSPNIRYINNLSLADLLRKKLRIAVGNDAKCFALAEAKLGQGKGHSSVVGLILGTGVGSGFVLNGKIYYGSHFGAGEIGHMVNEKGERLEHLYQYARDAHDEKKLASVAAAIFTNTCRAFDPEILVVGGGAALDNKRKFFGIAVKACEKLLSSYRIKPKIVKSKLKNAGAIGAALLVA